MFKIVCLFAFVAFLQTATALQCYTCDPKSCENEMSKWTKVANCGSQVAFPDKQTGACLKTKYMDKLTNKEVTVRKCILADKMADGKVSFACKDTEGKVSVCEVCNTDWCNSAPAVSVSFVTFLGVVAAYFVPKYFL
ncbi:uncharacterized protein LOC126740494 [Anthonomus grandis grandis]|uniref:uncharacterized protein LOC126740494 n=1 Tax=Anthonomus grandis grandis TaxID=2921223 RepID=UPI002165CC06|nr:uncharacterized protein LOC126740494 [Anthonomus grandis grandis]